MKRTVAIFLLAWSAAGTHARGAALDVNSGNRIELHAEEAYARPVLLWGADVRLAGRAMDDVFVAAQTLDMSGRADGDFWALADKIAFTGTAADHVRLAGTTVQISGTLERGLLAIGQTVKIASGAEIRGAATIRATDVIIEGAVRGPIRIVAQNVTLAGTIGGDARITADEIVALPRARIEGALAYTSPREFFPDPRATLGGALVRIPAAETRSAWPLIFFAGALLAGAPFILIFPRFAGAGVRSVRESFAGSLLVGLVAAGVLPLAILFGSITVVGLPLALATAAAGGTLLYLGQFPVALALGGWLLRRRGPQPAGVTLAAFAAGLSALHLLVAIPMAGPIVSLAARLVGFGSLLRALTARNAAPPSGPPLGAAFGRAVEPPPLPPQTPPGASP